jgi:hypothetical protein
MQQDTINLQKSVAFVYTNNEEIEKEYRTIQFTIASKKKNQIPRSKHKKSCK